MAGECHRSDTGPIMIDPAFLSSAALGRLIASGHDALCDEVDPDRLRAAAASVRTISPPLARQLDAKAERGIEVRVLLGLALIGELAPDVTG